MNRKGGLRRKTRYLSKKSLSERGKLSISRYLQSFKADDKVELSWESAVQKGMYHPRFYGKRGIVKGKQGKCYEILITDGNKPKTLIVHPIHLRKM